MVYFVFGLTAFVYNIVYFVFGLTVFVYDIVYFILGLTAFVYNIVYFVFGLTVFVFGSCSQVLDRSTGTGTIGAFAMNYLPQCSNSCPIYIFPIYSIYSISTYSISISVSAMLKLWSNLYLLNINIWWFSHLYFFLQYFQYSIPVYPTLCLQRVITILYKKGWLVLEFIIITNRSSSN